MLKNAARLANQTQFRFLGIKNVEIKNPSAEPFTEMGIPAGIGSIKVTLEEGKQYSYCNCGYSNRQPFCDGSHKLEGRTNIRPIRFTVNKTGEYNLCQCKQSKIRPICDGSHKKVGEIHSNKQ